ncbi:MAG: ABC transporter ATP-binding protein/permease [Dysgonamonadaceae bacterium]|jgi:ABC-type multidrug transport system fused ATPase/permease subunit|nr:ABC transporter ATP-binding protein/permease [Dysgonamonadaceae bacterium]
MEYSKLKSQLNWAWSVTKGYRSGVLLYCTLQVMSLGFSLAFIYWSKQAVDISTGMRPGALKITLVYIIACVFLSVLTGVASTRINEYVRIKVNIQLQNSLIWTQMTTLWQQAKQWHTGDLLVRINSDCSETTQMLVSSVPSFLVTCVQLGASLGFLWIMDPMLAMMILYITPLFLFSKLYYKKMRNLSKAVKKAESLFGTVLHENLKNRLLIMGLRAVKVRWKKILASQDSLFQLKMNQLKFSTLTQVIIKLTFNGGYLLAFLWGIYRLHGNEISYGTMTAFLQLVGRIQMPILSMIAFIPAAIRSQTAIERLMVLYEGEKESSGRAVKTTPPLRLTMENLHFRYEDRNVIEDFSATMETGKPTAIVGVSGKGKTTLIRLMLALIKPDKGSLFIESGTGKIDVSASTRNNFAYVPQGNTLFSGTIRENLLLMNPSASNKQLSEALNIACAEFVFSLPDGLDTEIGESSSGLSEGQAQRIAIARALLRDCGIWLFDEITSALDLQTSRRLIDNLMTAGKDKIMIFVTHDMLLADSCPQVIRLS